MLLHLRNVSLSTAEIKGLKKIVEAGRGQLDVGKSVNPVLILTARELFGQFDLGEFSEIYANDSKLARGIFMRGEIREISELCSAYTSGCHQAMMFGRRRFASDLPRNNSSPSFPSIKLLFRRARIPAWS